MSEMPGRMLRLLSLLQSRREWSGRELAEHLGVTERTVRRDIDRLRALDYPITGTTGTAGGYRLGPGSQLPPLLLDDDEAIAVALGLVSAGSGGVSGIAASSMSALAKLTQVLPARLRPQLAAMASAEAIPRLGVPQVDPDVLATLARCSRNHEVVGFEYVSRQDVSTRRRVEPHQLLTVAWHWYLLAFDPTRDDWRFFRVDRISAVSPVLHRFAPRPLPADDAASYLVESFAQASYRHSVQLTVQLPADEVAAHFYGFVPGRIAPAGPTSCVAEFSAETPSLLLQLVAGIVALGADFTVDEASPETRAMIASVGERLQSFRP
ncbi:WYL domain-containing transcriptional regulator [Kribbella antibiotica]|uniref:WYL domain-containing transcriptional regulator n=1 Tax=Kribbella antibiotica TaxID=190195 RepID=A0A4R4ZUZ0_9ACTN|nr:WYL domain-containing protein [Kribbella antibiotica]TDD62300.1 WYL domain-containing transcriptional regulator [Kribbella antibiotica]